MKKTFLLLLTAGSLFFAGCNSNKEKESDKEEKTSTLRNNTDEEEETVESPSSDIKKAAMGYCDCFNESMDELDPRLKRMIIKAGESPNPIQVIQTEMMKVKDPEEQQKLGQQMQNYTEGGSIENCTNKISKKYDLNDQDPKVQRQMLNALEDNEDCEILVALMKIGMKQENTTRDNNISDEE